MFVESEGFFDQTINTTGGARPSLSSQTQTMGNKLRKSGQIKKSERIKKLAMARCTMDIDKGELAKSFIEDSNIENYTQLILEKMQEVIQECKTYGISFREYEN